MPTDGMDTADEILRNDNVRIKLETAFSFYGNDNMAICPVAVAIS